MPTISGVEIQKMLKTQLINIPIIFITGYADINVAIAAMKAGAHDFILKPIKDHTLLESINEAFRTQKNKYNENMSHNKTIDKIKTLTKREKEIMDHVVDGKLNRNIAKLLNISIKTVELHLSHVMQKMVANTFAELVRMSLIAKTY